MQKVFQVFIVILLLFSVAAPTQLEAAEKQNSLVNLEHLDFLNEEITLDGKEMLIIHIYSEYPDYEWVDDADEGIACVDDVARAAVVYLNHYEQTKDKTSLEKAKKALNFVMYMQADDGEFYNFIFDDYSINTDGPTSKKSFDWWAARAMWSIGHGYKIFSKTDPAYAKELKESFLLANDALQKKVNEKYGEYNIVNGYKVPAWIGGFDAMSNALLGLSEYYEVQKDPLVKDSMLKLGKGLSEYQFGSYTKYPFGAHLGWDGSPTLWHAWGSGQSMALAKAGNLLNKKEWIESAKQEADQFFTHILATGMIKEMAPTPSKDEQIAYGVNMLTQAFTEIYHATKEKKYARYAGIAASWYTGNNDANFQMYDPETGRGYDGLNGVTGKVNLNSGAESTIEALMAIQQLPEAMNTFYVKTKERHTSTIHEAEAFTVKNGSPVIETPEDAWTGDALFSNKIVKLNNGDMIQKEVNIDKKGLYLIYGAMEKTPALGGELKLEVKIDGRKVSSTDVSAANKYLTLVNLNKLNYLTAGKHTITLTAKPPYNETLTLDNVVVQPVNEYAVFVEGGKRFKLQRNLITEHNSLR
ncbi:hypothetical protein [Fictibacillus phosphorivorans]|uniref:hypothetical protein n=1 Tax=Fictibacillus phosphorivorans TaxID=1221500 RepID=UPI00204190A3|nr:hypothetical protein [Fictibacillus phosphorivorans]MCM3717757.1 hypothetical protein [Fictibacillus phosphorivorans]MCM3775658.1 hypothetical protein [Fictibacillus phosphorivorans]